MKKKRKSDYYSSLRHEQSLARKEKSQKDDAPELKEIRRFRFLRTALLPNLPDLLLNNLCFGLTCLPALLFLELALQTGGLTFLAGTWLSMALLFPGLSALYHRSYDYTRRIASSVRTSFFSFFATNFGPCALTGLFLGFFWTLCCLYLLMAQVWMADSPSFYGIILLLLLLCSHYTVMVMAQLSLFDLPPGAVYRNALLPDPLLRLARPPLGASAAGFRPAAVPESCPVALPVLPGAARPPHLPDRLAALAQAQPDSAPGPGRRPLNACSSSA